jgi:hypothetical protein
VSLAERLERLPDLKGYTTWEEAAKIWPELCAVVEACEYSSWPPALTDALDALTKRMDEKGL